VGELSETVTKSHNAFTPHLALWEASYAAIERGDIIHIDDRTTLCSGICNVFALLPDEQRVPALESLAAHALRRLERTPSPVQGIGYEIQLLSSMARSFADAQAEASDGMESGCDTSPDRRAPIPQPLLDILHRAWPSIAQIAANISGDEVGSVSSALCRLFLNMHSQVLLS